jgi:glycosyltransferase involved in cell wall biosynthesis
VARVSVVIPTYNRGKVLTRAVDSVLAQRYRDWELIVVDDGSTDDTQQRLALYAERRLRVIVRPENGGVAAARNAGIAAAEGELVAFLDSDDQWLPNALESLVAGIERGPAAPKAVTSGFYFNRSGSPRLVPRHPSSRGDWFLRLLDGCPIAAGSALLVRRECFETVGGFDESLRRMEDWDWLLRFMEAHRFDVVPDLLAIVYVGARPQPQTIAKAAARLLERNADRIVRRAGRAGLRRFTASLELDHAAAAFHAGQKGWAAIRLLRMATLSPTRAGQFAAQQLADIINARRADLASARKTPGG